MHKTRMQTLCVLVESLFHVKFFSLTGLGLALKTNAQDSSAIRRGNRFLGNISASFSIVKQHHVELVMTPIFTKRNTTG